MHEAGVMRREERDMSKKKKSEPAEKVLVSGDIESLALKDAEPVGPGEKDLLKDFQIDDDSLRTAKPAFTDGFIVVDRERRRSMFLRVTARTRLRFAPTPLDGATPGLDRLMFTDPKRGLLLNLRGVRVPGAATAVTLDFSGRQVRLDAVAADPETAAEARG